MRALYYLAYSLIWTADKVDAAIGIGRMVKILVRLSSVSSEATANSCRSASVSTHDKPCQSGTFSCERRCEHNHIIIHIP